jgi:UTP--glucose-1-phosphate uridylyltransferase
VRESGQAPTKPGGEIIPEFQDVSKYRHFNTNTIWLDLEAVLKVAQEHDGTIPLPLISNKKTVNPRDRASRRVIQIETAMGAAIEVFEGALALQVPRSRFAPVKSNNDLLVVRSDVYTLSADFTLNISSQRTLPGVPLVSLEPHYFGLLHDFEQRVKVTPSLLNAVSLSVRGDVEFVRPLEIVGQVQILGNPTSRSTIPLAVTRVENEELVLP